MTFDDFSANAEKQDAVLRRLTIIGDAVTGLPPALRDRYPSVPWKEIAGARDMLVLEYFRVGLELTWEMVQDDLPELAASETFYVPKGFRRKVRSNPRFPQLKRLSLDRVP